MCQCAFAPNNLPHVTLNASVDINTTKPTVINLDPLPLITYNQIQALIAVQPDLHKVFPETQTTKIAIRADSATSRLKAFASYKGNMRIDFPSKTSHVAEIITLDRVDASAVPDRPAATVLREPSSPYKCRNLPQCGIYLRIFRLNDHYLSHALTPPPLQILKPPSASIAFKTPTWHCSKRCTISTVVATQGPASNRLSIEEHGPLLFSKRATPSVRLRPGLFVQAAACCMTSVTFSALLPVRLTTGLICRIVTTALRSYGLRYYKYVNNGTPAYLFQSILHANTCHTVCNLKRQCQGLDIVILPVTSLEGGCQLRNDALYSFIRQTTKRRQFSALIAIQPILIDEHFSVALHICKHRRVGHHLPSTHIRCLHLTVGPPNSSGAHNNRVSLCQAIEVQAHICSVLHSISDNVTIASLHSKQGSKSSTNCAAHAAQLTLASLKKIIHRATTKKPYVAKQEPCVRALASSHPSQCLRGCGIPNAIEGDADLAPGVKASFIAITAQSMSAAATTPEKFRIVKAITHYVSSAAISEQTLSDLHVVQPFDHIDLLLAASSMPIETTIADISSIIAQAKLSVPTNHRGNPLEPPPMPASLALVLTSCFLPILTNVIDCLFHNHPMLSPLEVPPRVAILCPPQATIWLQSPLPTPTGTQGRKCIIRESIAQISASNSAEQNRAASNSIAEAEWIISAYCQFAHWAVCILHPTSGIIIPIDSVVKHPTQASDQPRLNRIITQAQNEIVQIRSIRTSGGVLSDHDCAIASIGTQFEVLKFRAKQQTVNDCSIFGSINMLHFLTFFRLYADEASSLEHVREFCKASEQLEGPEPAARYREATIAFLPTFVALSRSVPAQLTRNPIITGRYPNLTVLSVNCALHFCTDQDGSSTAGPPFVPTAAVPSASIPSQVPIAPDNQGQRNRVQVQPAGANRQTDDRATAAPAGNPPEATGRPRIVVPPVVRQAPSQSSASARSADPRGRVIPAPLPTRLESGISHTASSHGLSAIIARLLPGTIETQVEVARTKCGLNAEFNEKQYANNPVPVEFIASFTSNFARRSPFGIVQDTYPVEDAPTHFAAISHCTALYDITPTSLQLLASDISRGKLAHVIALMPSKTQFLRIADFLHKHQVKCAVTWIRWYIDVLYMCQSALFPGLVVDLLGHQWTQSIECAAASAYHILAFTKLPIRAIAVTINTKKAEGGSVQCYLPAGVKLPQATLAVHSNAELLPRLVRLCQEWRASKYILNFHHATFRSDSSSANPGNSQSQKTDACQPVFTVLITGKQAMLELLYQALLNNDVTPPLAVVPTCLLITRENLCEGVIAINYDSDTVKFFAQSANLLQGLPPHRPPFCPISKATAIIANADSMWWTNVMSLAAQWETSWTWWPIKIVLSGFFENEDAAGLQLKIGLSSPFVRLADNV